MEPVRPGPISDAEGGSAATRSRIAIKASIGRRT
jgi:hypothetical protein